jgi:hypothetical protein
MKLYVAITGLMFLLIFAAHVARIFAEGAGPLGEPIFLLTSALSLLIVVWATFVWRRP